MNKGGRNLKMNDGYVYVVYNCKNKKD